VIADRSDMGFDSAAGHSEGAEVNPSRGAAHPDAEDEHSPQAVGDAGMAARNSIKNETGMTKSARGQTNQEQRRAEAKRRGQQQGQAAGDDSAVNAGERAPKRGGSRRSTTFWPVTGHGWFCPCASCLRIIQRIGPPLALTRNALPNLRTLGRAAKKRTRTSAASHEEGW